MSSTKEKTTYLVLFIRLCPNCPRLNAILLTVHKVCNLDAL